MDKFIELMEQNPEFTAANGETLRYRDYLDKAIAGLGLKPYDYFTVISVLKSIAELHNVLFCAG